METQAPSYSTADALRILFGAPPFGTLYTTDHIRKVLSKLCGCSLTEEAVLQVLREAQFATPRPSTSSRHLLKWKFTYAEDFGSSTTATTPQARRANRPPRREKSVAASQNLKQ